MRKTKVKNLLPLVNAVTIAFEGYKEGREMPFIIVNANGHEDFLSNLEAHRTSDLPGDMIFTWAWPKSRFSKPMVYMKIDFIKPIKCLISISIDPVLYGEIIDAVLLSKTLTIVHGQDDIANLIQNNSPSISIDVPETATFPVWEKVYLNALTKRYRKQGISKKKSIELAKQQISFYRNAWINKNFEGRNITIVNPDK